VLVGITDTVFEESIAVARYAAEQGADAVVLAPPYYLSASQPELLDYVGAIVAQLPLPLVVYNIPVLTKVAFEPETVQKMTQFERVVGVKDSSGSIPYLRKIVACLSQRPDWSLLTGRDDLLAETICLGGHGGVCGGANVFPRLFVTLAKAAREGDVNLVASLEVQVANVGAKLYTVGRDMPGFIKGIKCALASLGICDDAMGGPLLRFDTAERQLIAERVSELQSDLAGILSD
jgi:4-hydroxy-tetrahydrodipicolinate synthase